MKHTHIKCTNTTVSEEGTSAALLQRVDPVLHRVARRDLALRNHRRGFLRLHSCQLLGAFPQGRLQRRLPGALGVCLPSNATGKKTGDNAGIWRSVKEEHVARGPWARIKGGEEQQRTEQRYTRMVRNDHWPPTSYHQQAAQTPSSPQRNAGRGCSAAHSWHRTRCPSHTGGGAVSSHLSHPARAHDGRHRGALSRAQTTLLTYRLDGTEHEAHT